MTKRPIIFSICFVLSLSLTAQNTKPAFEKEVIKMEADSMKIKMPDAKIKTIKQDDGSVYVGESEKKIKNGYGTMFYSTGNIYRGNWVSDVISGYGTMIFPNGDRYEGEWKDGMKAGKGTFKSPSDDFMSGIWENDSFLSGSVRITYENGDKYSGGWKNGKRDGRGELRQKNGDFYIGVWEADGFVSGNAKVRIGQDLYVGEWKNTSANGKGKAIYSDGSIYNGGWEDGEFSGQGSYSSSNGDYYIGEWKKGKYDGQGILTTKKGAKFSGEWKNGDLNGKGSAKYSNGDKYEGEWKNGEYSVGTYTTKEGTQYSGEWEDGMLNGKAKASYADGAEYDGWWIDSKFYGSGVFKYSNGDVYDGNWTNGKKDGKGTLIFTDGRKYEGEWKDGKYYGQGVFTYRDGSTYSGSFVDDMSMGEGFVSFKSGLEMKGMWLNDKVFEGDGTYKEYNFKINKTTEGFYIQLFSSSNNLLCAYNMDDDTSEDDIFASIEDYPMSKEWTDFYNKYIKNSNTYVYQTHLQKDLLSSYVVAFFPGGGAFFAYECALDWDYIQAHRYGRGDALYLQSMADEYSSSENIYRASVENGVITFKKPARQEKRLKSTSAYNSYAVMGLSNAEPGEEEMEIVEYIPAEENACGIYSGKRYKIDSSGNLKDLDLGITLLKTKMPLEDEMINKALNRSPDFDTVEELKAYQKEPMKGSIVKYAER